MKNNYKPSEVRWRNVEDSYLKKLDAIAKARGFSTYTRVLEFLTDNYEPSIARIAQLEKEVRDTRQKLSYHESITEDLKENISDHIENLQDQIRVNKALLSKIGTKKRPAAAGTPG